jgi:hypothetical protein
MSGLVKDNIFGSSGLVVEAAGGLSWQSVVTASTVTVSAAKGYFINTTSNACTITLPSAAEAGDQIILIDYARTWGTNAITIDSNGLNFQGSPDTYTVDYDTAGQSLNLVYSDATIGWTPSSDIANALEPYIPVTQKAIFAYGHNYSAHVSMSNLVNSSGVVASDVSGVGTARNRLAATGYGTDKAIMAYGTSGSTVSLSNLVNNSGVIAADVTGVGTARNSVAATGYGTDKGIFAYGYSGSASVSVSNLVSNSGVVASDVSGVGTARNALGAAGYGVGLAIFAYGVDPSGGDYSLKNLVNISGVIAADVTGVGTARSGLAAANYGTGLDKAIFYSGINAGGTKFTVRNLVNNVGTVASDATGAGTARMFFAGASYGGDKAIFAYGDPGDTTTNVSNLVSNVGVVSADVTGVGTSRYGPGAAGFSTSA